MNENNQQVLRLGGEEFSIDLLSDDGRAKLALFQHTTKRLHELANMRVLLNKAKQSYVETLKKEILATKSGLTFED